jgi:hypothetical protein
MENPTMRLILPVVFAAFVLAPAKPMRGQTAPQAVKPSLQASRATQAIRLDGKLDDVDWAKAAVATDFIQRYPDPGKPATLRTEVRVLYDNDAIYVGARMFDPSPDSIAAPLARRDPQDINSDWIDVIFDSYHDRRTGYRFGVNPAGTKLDVYHFNDDNDDDKWDARWDVATRIDSLGWTAEYRIPLSQLRFHGNAGEQVWGLQFYRAVARHDEWTHWSPYPPTTPGFISAFGQLTGLVGLQPPSSIEVTPYATSHVTTGNEPPQSPFRRPQRLGSAAGVDFRVGLGPALSVTGAVNPDFGQVEVDPAVINLSGVETFFPEKRPFFLEGAGIFEFGSPPVSAAYGFSRFVHWRRIGRTPQMSPSAEWIDAPEQTTILGAAKLSGQLANGWSLGVMDAMTQREEARLIDVSGERSVAAVEPLTNYFVARAKRDFDDGRSNVGLLSTATNRRIDGAFADNLRGAAYLLGADALRASADRRWTLAGYFVHSRVTGSAAAIAATQRSSVRYMNRPDASYLHYDSTARSLDGHDASLSVLYQGKPWFGSAQFHETSPGYESNDLGYLSRADVRSLTAAFGATHTGSGSLFRDSRVMGYTQHAWNYGGDVIYRRFGVTGSAQLASFWNVSASATYRPPFLSDARSRGGPLMTVAQQWGATAGISSDRRKIVIGNLSASVEVRPGDASRQQVFSGLTLRPSSSLQFSLAPTLDVVRDQGQYIRTLADPSADATYGHRYVFATLRQRTASVDIRGDWTLTPALSFQLFAQPFVSTARLDGYKELRAPRTFSFDVYGRDRGSVNYLSSGNVVIDPDGSGQAQSFTLSAPGERSFLSRALRVNAVLRWEYRGGSTLYVVWQQTRDGSSTPDFDGYDSGLGRVFNVPAKNVLLVKASYRLGR